LEKLVHQIKNFISFFIVHSSVFFLLFFFLFLTLTERLADRENRENQKFIKEP